VVAAATAKVFCAWRRRERRGDAVGKTARTLLTELALDARGEDLIGVAPRGHADLLDVLEHVLGDHLVEVPGPAGAKDVDRAELGARHHRGGAGDRVAEREEPFDERRVDLAEEIPHR